MRLESDQQFGSVDDFSMSQEASAVAEDMETDISLDASKCEMITNDFDIITNVDILQGLQKDMTILLEHQYSKFTRSTQSFRRMPIACPKPLAVLHFRIPTTLLARSTNVQKRGVAAPPGNAHCGHLIALQLSGEVVTMNN